MNWGGYGRNGHGLLQLVHPPALLWKEGIRFESMTRSSV